jgi:AcrR family transcriptional regulator
VPRTALEKAREAPSSTKGRILSAAEEIFASKGFAGASTRDIAAAAQVNISGLHYHWDSKETLYFSVFQNVYDRILEVVRAVVPATVSATDPRRAVIDEAMGRLFDFFADNPNIPKLLLRRLLESGEGGAEIERDILLPAWQMFAKWTAQAGSPRVKELDVQVFMLEVHSVLLLFLVDSPQYTDILGGGVRTPAVRKRLRKHVIDLVHRLIDTGK